MKTKPASAPEPKKINVFVELTKGLYPNLEIRLGEIGAAERNRIISQIETMAADEAIGYMMRLDAMKKGVFEEHVKMFTEGSALSLLLDKAKKVEQAVVAFHEKQKPGNPSTFFERIKKDFNRGKALAR
jgi:hypothetical protein